MKHAFWVLPGFLAGAAAGLGFGVFHWRSAIDAYYPATRAAYVRNQIAQAGPVDTLVIGDSISKSTFLYGVCGRTFNASVGGSTVPVELALARFAIPKLKPKTIIVETGRNYFHHGDNPAFEPDFHELLSALHGHKLILVGIPLAPKETEFVRRTAQAVGAEFVMPATGNLTIEGVHPTPKGALVYRQRIAAACRQFRPA